MDHFDDTFTGGMGRLGTLAVRGRDCGCCGQGHADGFGQAVHRQSGTHDVAVSGAWGRGREQVHELLLVDLPGAQSSASFPDDSPCSGQLAIEIAVEHWTAVKDQRRQIGRGCGHHGRWSGLVATGGKNHSIEGISVKDFDKSDVG